MLIKIFLKNFVKMIFLLFKSEILCYNKSNIYKIWGGAPYGF